MRLAYAGYSLQIMLSYVGKSICNIVITTVRQNLVRLIRYARSHFDKAAHCTSISTTSLGAPTMESASGQGSVPESASMAVGSNVL